MWTAWSGFGRTHLVRKQASVQESLGPVPAERNWPATTFPLSDSVAFFHRWPGSCCAKLARILFGSGCFGFWLNRSGLEASRCAVQESSGSILAKASELICIISGMFTGNKSTQSKLPQRLCVFPQSHGDTSTRLPSSATENNKNKCMISATKPKGNQMPADGNI